jgi:hypothetical protein
VISRRRRAELALLTAEATLCARAPDAGRPLPDLAEWCAEHAAVCPDLAARLPQVTRLLRCWPGRFAQAEIATAALADALSHRVDDVVLTAREAAEQLQVTASGSRWLAARGRFPGARRHPVTGRWQIPAAAVNAYAADRRQGRAGPHPGQVFPGNVRTGPDQPRSAAAA